jgi:hypothetical protein
MVQQPDRCTVRMPAAYALAAGSGKVNENLVSRSSPLTTMERRGKGGSTKRGISISYSDCLPFSEL